MPRRQTLSHWRSRCKKRADKENDNHIADPEWDSLMAEVYGDLYQIVVDGAGAYFQTTHAFTADGSESYDEPDDHLSTISLDRVESSGLRTPLVPVVAQERHLFSTLTGDAEHYTLIDNQIFLYPKPSSGNYELLYIPQAPDLTTYVDADELDAVNIYGEQFLVYGTAALALSKSESDVRFLLSRQQRAEQKLMEWAAQRSFTEPHRRHTDESEIDPVPYLGNRRRSYPAP